MQNLCYFGCLEPARFRLKNGKPCCSETVFGCRAIKRKQQETKKRNGTSGPPKWASDTGRLSRRTEIYQSYLCSREFPAGKKVSARASQLIFCFLGLERRCFNCNLSEWGGKEITLELDHINGNNKNNEFSNLRFLCPNCHSLTPTWKGRNKKTCEVNLPPLLCPSLHDIIPPASPMGEAAALSPAQSEFESPVGD